MSVRKAPPVTVEMLARAGACGAGIAAFRRAFGERLDVTEAACLAKAREIGPYYWRWAAKLLCGAHAWASDHWQAQIKGEKAATVAARRILGRDSDCWVIANKAARAAFAPSAARGCARLYLAHHAKRRAKP